jgi:predicted metal-dependent hydrolase
MNLHPSRVSFRFNKTRWGSCSYKNSIVFNYYLAKLPEDVIEYVVVHELAHIKHKNHQKNFWALVGEFLPDFKNRLKKLREIEKEF